MKIAKKYFAFAAIMAILILGKFYILSDEDGAIDDFRGGNITTGLWSHLVADEVNSGLLTVTIDSHQFTNDQTKIFMDDKRNIMVPVSILRDSMNCSVHVYDGTTLLVEKHNYEITFEVDSVEAASKDEVVYLSSPLRYVDDELYISLDDLSKILNYKTDFDIASKNMVTSDTSKKSSFIPSRYDLREKKRNPKVRDQGIFGTCWAFAATSAMESFLMPEQSDVFAVDHMVYANSFKTNEFEGGDYLMGMAYLAAWQGPVLEKDDAYGDGRTDRSLSEVCHVQEMQIIDGKDYVAIKEAVFKYGGVQSSLYSTIKSGAGSTAHYNSETYGYCYIGTEKPNHDVVIIGWDDNYSKDNFNASLEGDGAFICQSSWGDSFGENGVFYVSYYDTNIGTHNIVYSGIEASDNYDHIYQSDLCGWVGRLGYNKESIYAANVYTAGSEEDICAAGFYATGANTEYEVYLVKNFENTKSFENKIPVASGTLGNAGFYTIDFDTLVTVEAGERYAVMIHITTPGANHPLAIEFDSGDKTVKSVDLEDGEGYISASGNRFINVKDTKDCNLCIKAYSKNRKR